MAVHRAADVQQDEHARDSGHAPEAWDTNGLAAGAEVFAQDAAQVRRSLAPVPLPSPPGP